MLSKKERTMDRYKKAGAEMRLLKTLGGNAAVDISLVLSAADTDKFLKALRMIEEVSLRAEDNIFRDHPALPDEYVDVFSGDTDKKPRNGVDEMMIDMAIEIASEYAKRKNN